MMTTDVAASERAALRALADELDDTCTAELREDEYFPVLIVYRTARPEVRIEVVVSAIDPHGESMYLAFEPLQMWFDAVRAPRMAARELAEALRKLGG